MFIRRFAIVSLHVIFWLLLIALPQYWVFTANESLPAEIIIYTVITSVYLIFLFYTFYLLLIPWTFKKNIKIGHAVMLFLLVAVFVFIIKSLIVLLINNLTGLDFAEHQLMDYRQQVSEAVNTAFLILVALMLRVSMFYLKDQRDRAELRMKEQQLELQLLKAQINPHFFFNTLNNIYSLVYKKSADAPAAVMKLSEIMRYMIYDSKSEMVPLEKEVEQIENYIELERLRIRADDFIRFEVSGDLSDHNIPPLLLLTFAENAFKHGKRKVSNPGICISIKADEKTIEYNVSNYILKEPHNNHQGEGIGMQNTRRRLELLYPGCHSLDIFRDDEKHEIKLRLNCKINKKGKV